ncbi:MAG: hypothetical protein ACPLPR_02240 [Bacillota bacterium]
MQVVDKAAEAQKEELRRLAFLGWQIQAPLRDKQIGFAEYLALLGLEEKREVEYDVAEAKEAALKRAQEILELFWQGQP